MVLRVPISAPKPNSFPSVKLNTLLDIVIENPKLNDKATLIALLDNLK